MAGPTVGQTVMVGSVSTTFRIPSDMVEGAYSVVEQVVAPGQLVWPHIHRDHDQLAVVLAGDLGVRVGDLEWTATPGSVAYRPRGLAHAVWNTGATPARFLEVTSPGDFEDYFLQLAGMAAESPEARSVLARRYGVSGVDGWEQELAERYRVGL